MDTRDLDRVDYALLAAVTDADEPLWKKRIHAYLRDHVEQLPIEDPVSLQTVGRRIDRLHEDEYVASDIVSPDGLNRDLIIGYTITQDGHDAFHAAGHALLKRYATADVDCSHAAAVALIDRHIPITPDTRQQLDDASTADLRTLIELAYAQERLKDGHDRFDMDKIGRLFHALPARQQDDRPA